MRLSLTISILLLALTAFSQEKLSYSDGIIKQGEKNISIAEFKKLCYDEGLKLNWIEWEYRRGPINYRFVRAQKHLNVSINNKNRLHQNKIIRLGSFLMVSSSIGLYSYWYSGWDFWYGIDGPEYIVAGWAGGILGTAGLYNLSKIKSTSSCKRKANRYFHKAVKRYNESISAQ
tara:strand:- start:21 stop:542 length:522 start_codon:yes stop_codon:yes gene_type:complete